MSLAFSVSTLADLSSFGFCLFLPVVVLPPRGKHTFIPGLGFGISGGSGSILSQKKTGLQLPEQAESSAEKLYLPESYDKIKKISLMNAGGNAL